MYDGLGRLVRLIYVVVRVLDGLKSFDLEMLIGLSDIRVLLGCWYSVS